MNTEQKQLALCWMAAMIFSGKIGESDGDIRKQLEREAVRSAVRIFNLIDEGMNKKEKP